MSLNFKNEFEREIYDQPFSATVSLLLNVDFCPKYGDLKGKGYLSQVHALRHTVDAINIVHAVYTYHTL